MKKFSKILLSLTLVLVAFVGILGFAGCGNEEKKVVNIGINKEIKTQYDVNEELNLDGLELILSFNDYSQANVKVSSDMITGFDTKTSGSKQMVIKYLDNSLTINYTVLAVADSTVTFDVAIAKAYDNLLNCKNVKIVVNRYLNTDSSTYNFCDELIRTNNLVKISNTATYLNLDKRKYYQSGEEYDASTSNYKDYLNDYLLMTEKFYAKLIDIAKVNEDTRTISIVNNKYVLNYSSSTTSNNTVRVEISTEFKVTAIVFNYLSSESGEVYNITYEYGVEELVYPVE